MEQQRLSTEERQREAQQAEELKRLEVEREKIAAKERAAEERKALEAARTAEIERLMALQKECIEERARRLLAEQQVTAASPQATGTCSPSVLPPPPTHTPFYLIFKSPVAPSPSRNTPRRSTPSVVTPVAHRWVPVSCLPVTTHEVNYAFMPSGPVHSRDLST